MRRSVRCLTVAFGLLMPALATAQESRGYFFGPPRGSLTFRMGVSKPSASSDIFRDVTDSLTIRRGDFTGFAFAADYALVFKERFEGVFSVGVANRVINSHYRNLVDNNDMEIEQVTTFRRVPMSIGARWYVVAPGQRVGRYAWVPNKVTAYLGAGIGGMYYRFHQEGDFVDYNTMDVINGEVLSEGWAAAANGAVGVGYSLTPRALFVTEMRYDAARAEMSHEFIGFNPIDLSGASLTAGLQLRF